MTVAGIVSRMRELPGASRTLAAPPQENAVPFWCLMFFTFVLFLSPQSILPSLAPLRLAMASAGLAAVAYLLNRMGNRRPLTVSTPEVHLVSWFALLAVMSIPLSLSPSGSLQYFVDTFVKSVIIFFLIANLLQTVGRLKLLIGFIALSGFIIATTALRNFAAGHMLPHDPGRIWGYPSPQALNPDGLGLVLNVMVPLTVGLYLATQRRPVKVLLAMGMTIMVGGIIASFSRAAFLALALTFLAFLAKLARVRGSRALVPAAALAVLGMLLAPAGYADRLYSIVDWKYDRVGSASRRWEEVQVASTFLLENPLIGAGLGMETLAYVDKGLGYGWKTHNIFLQVGADLALPGLLVYVLLFVQVVRGLRQTQRSLGPVPQAREVVAIATGLELAVYSYLVCAFFLPFAYDWTIYYLAGMAAAIRGIGARLAPSPHRTQ